MLSTGQATIVVADGSILTASDTENQDLFWGIRGGGCNFGVCTEFVLKLHPQRRMVYSGVAIFTADKLEKLVALTTQWWVKGPSEKEGMLQVFTQGCDKSVRIRASAHSTFHPLSSVSCRG
jgi:FAD/FMN-containing dehydrogenase